jgi:undecaprenyl-diphosphatase
MFSQVYLWDVHLFRLINGEWHRPWLDFAMAWISDFNFWKWPLIIAAMYFLCTGKFREKVLVILVGVALLIGDGILIQGVRLIVNRGRPWQTLEKVRFVDIRGVEVRKPGPYFQGRSMPSGHVCNHTAAGVIVTMLYPPWGKLIWLWVALMAYSRVYTGSHFPSDVLVSVLLSLVYTYVICVVARKLWKPVVRANWPKFYEKYPDLFPK